TESTRYHPLAPPAQLRQQVRGKGVLIYGNHNPAQLQLRRDVGSPSQPLAGVAVRGVRTQREAHPVIAGESGVVCVQTSGRYGRGWLRMHFTPTSTHESTRSPLAAPSWPALNTRLTQTMSFPPSSVLAERSRPRRPTLLNSLSNRPRRAGGGSRHQD